jgi:hypothetical protein
VARSYGDGMWHDGGRYGDALATRRSRSAATTVTKRHKTGEARIQRGSSWPSRLHGVMDRNENEEAGVSST